MKRRYFTRCDYCAFLVDEKPNWAVYDRKTKDCYGDPMAIAVFAKRFDALMWAARKNAGAQP